jgi:hypothetical protein
MEEGQIVMMGSPEQMSKHFAAGAGGRAPFQLIFRFGT